MPGWESRRKMVATELVQAREEGRDGDFGALQGRLERACKDENPRALQTLWDELTRLPLRAGFAFEEPNDLATIRALRPDGPRRAKFDASDDALFDRLHGAWLGRCVGCALGKPVERFMGAQNGLASWQRQKTYLSAISDAEWPLRDYFPRESPASDQTGALWCPLSTREEIAFMETDDDIRYTVLGQIVLRQHGHDFSTRDVADAWMAHLPYKMVCTAETQAYRNLVERTDFHLTDDSSRADDAVDWNWVATHQNPYREWIGAQIRVDSYGYACPGDLEKAAEFAWRDARLSHVKNGIYGAMLCAALIAGAFVIADARELVEAALAEIPASSRLYAELRDVIAICEQNNNEFARFEAVIEAIYARLGHYHPVHTNNNAALVVAALLLAQGDFERGVTFAVMGGWDSDCNGATVGSILGAQNGAKALPEYWTSRLHDTLNSAIPGYHPISISECARRSVEIVRSPARKD